MAKITSSRCKKLIAEITGTNEKDWKRIKKYKNVNVYRVFSNGIMNMEVITTPNDDSVISIGPNLNSINTRKYNFCVVPHESYSGGDYIIFVTDDKGSDSIGSHIPEVDEVMHPLGIGAEDMENTFSGTFDEKFKTINDVRNHIEKFGWEYDKQLEKDTLNSL